MNLLDRKKPRKQLCLIGVASVNRDRVKCLIAVDPHSAFADGTPASEAKEQLLIIAGWAPRLVHLQWVL